MLVNRANKSKLGVPDRGRCWQDLDEFVEGIEHDTPNSVLHSLGRRLAGETDGRLVQKSLLYDVQI